MIPVSYYLFYILHSIDFFRKVSKFSKINSALHYYEFSYKDLKYLNKYQQSFVNFLTEWCVSLTVVCLLFKAPFMLLIRATNSFCSYHWILMSVCIDQWRAITGLCKSILQIYANLSCISIKRCRCIFIGQNSKIIIFFLCSFFVLVLLLKPGDIEINPGPKKKLLKCLCCH